MKGPEIVAALKGIINTTIGSARLPCRGRLISAAAQRVSSCVPPDVNRAKGFAGARSCHHMHHMLLAKVSRVPVGLAWDNAITHYWVSDDKFCSKRRPAGFYDTCIKR